MERFEYPGQGLGDDDHVAFDVRILGARRAAQFPNQILVRPFADDVYIGHPKDFTCAVALTVCCPIFLLLLCN